MERRASWNRALVVLRKKAEEGLLSSKERTLMKVLDEKNSPLYISDFLEDCSDFKVMVKELAE